MASGSQWYTKCQALHEKNDCILGLKINILVQDVGKPIEIKSMAGELKMENVTL